MCVIIVKPYGVSLPSDIIRRCWYKNPDGAGIAYADENSVQIEKGFMQLKEFENYLSAIDLDEKSAIIHFRISTSGGINPEMTHPFPLTDSLPLLKATSIQTPIAIVHNGIIPIYPERGLSDTATYISQILVPRYKKKPDFYDDENNRLKILDEINSKMVILNKDYFYMIGDFTEYKNLYFSNMFWQNYSNKRKQQFFSQKTIA